MKYPLFLIFLTNLFLTFHWGQFAYGQITGTIEVSGFLRTEEGNGIGNATVRVTNNTEGINETIVTGGDGFYSIGIGTNSTENEITISPEKDINPNNGVTTLDMVLIMKSILFIDQLGSPYKIIAADVNRTSTLSTLDLVHIRNVILYPNTGFPNGTSWIFVDADQVFLDPLSPFPVQETFTFTGISGAQAQKDFIGLKTGDVNGTAFPEN